MILFMYGNNSNQIVTAEVRTVSKGGEQKRLKLDMSSRDIDGNFIYHISDGRVFIQKPNSSELTLYKLNMTMNEVIDLSKEFRKKSFLDLIK